MVVWWLCCGGGGGVWAVGGCYAAVLVGVGWGCVVFPACARLERVRVYFTKPPARYLMPQKRGHRYRSFGSVRPNY